MKLYNSLTRKREDFVPNHPDIDGLVLFSGDCTEGELCDVCIDSVEDGLLFGHREAEA